MFIRVCTRFRWNCCWLFSLSVSALHQLYSALYITVPLSCALKRARRSVWHRTASSSLTRHFVDVVTSAAYRWVCLLLALLLLLLSSLILIILIQSVGNLIACRICSSQQFKTSVLPFTCCLLLSMCVRIYRSERQLGTVRIVMLATL
jgi:hypothetical protein